jgi:hypothetical protein
VLHRSGVDEAQRRVDAAIVIVATLILVLRLLLLLLLLLLARIAGDYVARIAGLLDGPERRV